MKNALWLAVAAVALAASGCSELRAASPGKSAYGGSATSAQVCEKNDVDCAITVKVDTSQAPCKLVFDPEITLVYRVHDVRIVWNLDGPKDYKFVFLRFKDEVETYRVQNASRITTPSKDQFHDKKVAARQAQVMDKNTKDGSWYYELEVSNGRDSCKVDPPMING